MPNRKILFASFLIVAIPFLITRLPFFLDYPLVAIDPDYLHYYTIVDQFNKGFFPTFIIRTPGYPIFLKLIYTFFDSIMAVVVIQNILSLMTALFFVYVIYRVYAGRWKYLPLTAAIAMAAFISSNNHLMADISLLTESLFVNFTILFFAFLILALHYKTHWLWLACSFSMASVILIRPTGVFLILIFLIVLVFLFIKQWAAETEKNAGNKESDEKQKKVLFFRTLVHFIKRRDTLSFSLPFAGILLLLSAYNYFTVGYFTLTGLYSEHALVSFTATFLEKKDTYDPEINKIIDEAKKKIMPHYKEVRDNSWDYIKLNRVLRRYYNRNRDFLFTSLLSLEEKDSFALYLKWRPLLSDMGRSAIKKHPILYLKYFYSNLVIYFFHNMNDPDFYQKLKQRYWKTKHLKNYYGRYIREGSSIRRYYKKAYAETLSDDFLKSFLKELWEPEPLPIFKIGNVKEKEVRIEPTFLQGVHRVYKKFHDFLFRNITWSFIFIFVLCFSFIKLVKSRFRHTGSLIMFTLTLSALLHGFIICMFSFAILRYSYTMEFAYYLSLFLFPLVLIPEPGEKAAPAIPDHG
ncbi:MAG: hypothetical protein KAT34_05240 [Candidatus Aminicenantes bacterium]|nr:hypothetical protein [Candidatus Aminicenantes bacterium]